MNRLRYEIDVNLDGVIADFGLEANKSYVKYNPIVFFYGYLIAEIDGKVQYGRTYDEVCSPLLDAYEQNGQRAYDALITLFSTLYPPVNAENLQTESFSIDPWTWQWCNEFGYLQTSTGADQPFLAFSELTADYLFDQYCPSIGVTRKPNVERTNQYYGGLRLATTNIVFPQGSLDPW